MLNAVKIMGILNIGYVSLIDRGGYSGYRLHRKSRLQC